MLDYGGREEREKVREGRGKGMEGKGKGRSTPRAIILATALYTRLSEPTTKI